MIPSMFECNWACISLKNIKFVEPVTKSTKNKRYNVYYFGDENSVSFEMDRETFKLFSQQLIAYSQYAISPKGIWMEEK